MKLLNTIDVKGQMSVNISQRIEDLLRVQAAVAYVKCTWSFLTPFLIISLILFTIIEE